MSTRCRYSVFRLSTTLPHAFDPSKSHFCLFPRHALSMFFLRVLQRPSPSSYTTRLASESRASACRPLRACILLSKFRETRACCRRARACNPRRTNSPPACSLIPPSGFIQFFFYLSSSTSMSRRDGYAFRQIRVFLRQLDSTRPISSSGSDRRPRTAAKGILNMNLFSRSLSLSLLYVRIASSGNIMMI